MDGLYSYNSHGVLSYQVTHRVSSDPDRCALARSTGGHQLGRNPDMLISRAMDILKDVDQDYVAGAVLVVSEQESA